jgi:hypothetical protein
MKLRNLFLSVALICPALLFANNPAPMDSTISKHFIGTSLWSVANLFPDPGDFYELDYGFRFSEKDVFLLRAITWKYDTPLGIPYGPSFESSDEEYPGYARSFGIGAGYQHYILKNLFCAAYATPFLQKYHIAGSSKTQNGFQLFLQAQVGYHIPLFQNRFYLEPALSFNFWPVNTNRPESFKQTDSRWPNYFLFEPHFNFGINL